jgi:hypothetical protein
VVWDAVPEPMVKYINPFLFGLLKWFWITPIQQTIKVGFSSLVQMNEWIRSHVQLGWTPAHTSMVNHNIPEVICFE